MIIILSDVTRVRAKEKNEPHVLSRAAPLYTGPHQSLPIVSELQQKWIFTNLFVEALPIVATSASTDLGTLGHLSTESQPIAALGDGVISMENIVYQALSQPSIPPGHLLPARLPSAIGDYFFLHQEFPDHWNNRQSHGEPPQLQNNYPIEHYYDNQQVLPQAAVRPSTVPDPVVSSQQLAYSSTKDQQHHYYLNTAALSSNRRTLVSQQSHVAASVPRRRRSRSRHIKFDLQINNPSEISQDSQTDFIIMDQLLEVYNRVRVLSASLERVNHGEAHNADSQENPDNFTVAELYRHTNTLVDILERLATARNGPNRGTGAQLATDPSESANRMLTLSLYVRLLKMFDNLFCLVRSHLAKADPKRDELSFPSGLLPKMNIGDAALGVHPAFHMSMTVELAIQYLNRLREARTSLGLTKSGNGNGTRSDGSSASEGLASASYTDVGEVNPSTIRSQEDALSHSLQHLMGELDDYMDAMDGIDAGAGAALAK